MIHIDKTISTITWFKARRVLYLLIATITLNLPSIAAASCEGVCDEFDSELECYWFMEDPCDYDLIDGWGNQY